MALHSGFPYQDNNEQQKAPNRCQAEGSANSKIVDNMSDEDKPIVADGDAPNLIASDVQLETAVDIREFLEGTPGDELPAKIVEASRIAAASGMGEVRARSALYGIFDKKLDKMLIKQLFEQGYHEDTRAELSAITTAPQSDAKPSGSPTAPVTLTDVAAAVSAQTPEMQGLILKQYREQEAREIAKQLREAKQINTEGAKDRIRAKMLDSDGLDEIEDPEPLVDGYLDIDTFARVTGKSNHGKSFLMVDMAACVALGISWHGHDVEQGNVVYVVAEGARGVKKRIRAWEQRFNGGRRIPNLYVYPEPIQISDVESWTALAELCRDDYKATLVILDTQARITTGLNENDAKDMGLLVEGCEQIRRETGACVALVHHLGHQGDQGRGSTAVLGALGTELSVVQDKNGKITVSQMKQKDEAKGAKIHFKLEDQDAGYVQKRGHSAGQPITSAVLVQVDGNDSDGDPLDMDDVRNDWRNTALPTQIETVAATRFATGKGDEKRYMLREVARYMKFAVNHGGTSRAEMITAIEAGTARTPTCQQAKAAWAWLQQNGADGPTDQGRGWITPVMSDAGYLAKQDGKHLWNVPDEHGAG